MWVGVRAKPTSAASRSSSVGPAALAACAASAAAASAAAAAASALLMYSLIHSVMCEASVKTMAEPTSSCAMSSSCCRSCDSCAPEMPSASASSISGTAAGYSAVNVMRSLIDTAQSYHVSECEWMARVQDSHHEERTRAIIR